MNSKWAKLLAALFAFSLIAAACGDSDDAADDTTETTEAAAGGDVDLAGKTVTITGSERSEEQVNAINAALDVLEERTGMEITFLGSAYWEA